MRSRGRPWLLLVSVLAACKPQTAEAPAAPRADARPEKAAVEPEASVSAVLPDALVPSEQTPKDERVVKPVVLFEGPVKVGNRTTYLHCAGPSPDTPPPLVLFESGLGDGADAWSAVLPEVARVARACAYDRLGVGSSSPAPLRNSLAQMVSQLRAVQNEVLPKESLVLVGHSLGGLLARLYASEYPEEVAGLVLVDAASEDAAEIWDFLPSAGLKKLRAGFDKSAEHLDFEAFREGMARVKTVSRAAGAQPLGGRPLIVLTGAKPGPVQVSREVDAKLLEAWLDLQAEMVRLSGNSVQLVTEDSGHYIQMEQPALVVQATLEVVRATRTGSRVQNDFAATRLPAPTTEPRSSGFL